MYSLQPGITASVVYRDQVVFSKGFGVKDKSKPGAPDGSTIFRIGSVSKVFAVSLVNEVYELYVNLCASPCGSGGIARMEELNENVVGAEGTEGSNCTSIEAAQQQRDLYKFLEFSFAVIAVFRIGSDSTIVFLCANFCLCAIFLSFVHV